MQYLVSIENKMQEVSFYNFIKTNKVEAKEVENEQQIGMIPPKKEGNKCVAFGSWEHIKNVKQFRKSIWERKIKF